MSSEAFPYSGQSVFNSILDALEFETPIDCETFLADLHDQVFTLTDPLVLPDHREIELERAPINPSLPDDFSLQNQKISESYRYQKQTHDTSGNLLPTGELITLDVKRIIHTDQANNPLDSTLAIAIEYRTSTELDGVWQEVLMYAHVDAEDHLSYGISTQLPGAKEPETKPIVHESGLFEALLAELGVLVAEKIRQSGR